MSSKTRIKLLIAGAVTVLIIVVLLIILPFNAKKDPFLESNVRPEIERLLFDEPNAAKKGMVVKEIDSDGDYVAVVRISLMASDYGNNSKIILQKDGESYKTIYSGSSVDVKYLKSLGVPQRIITAAFYDGRVGKYVEAITKSSENPFIKYPIIKHLPQKSKSGSYTIAYGFKDNYDINSFYLSIKSAVGYRQDAVRAIYNLGFDPGDYTIVFTNYTNPFKEPAK